MASNALLSATYIDGAGLACEDADDEVDREALWAFRGGGDVGPAVELCSDATKGAQTTDVDGKESWPELVALTSFFSVELPGIEPGSYGIPSRLLRAQFAKSLLGSLGHANKPR